ncbi:MAG: O-antigen ligase family protein [Candidatus Krumholzibacteriota bacterium]|nr:O-antigen ligase family protein [Candidatus Krumholzibacteriota bacterium]
MKEADKIRHTKLERVRNFISSFPLGKVFVPIFLLIAAAMLGKQVFDPSKRVIEAVVGIVFIVILWNFSTLGAIWLLLVIYPLPFGISLGNSNFIFAVIIFLIYMIRVSSGIEKFETCKLVNLPVALLVLSYIISIYNMQGTPLLVRWGITSTVAFFSTLLILYMMINLIDNELKLKRTLNFLMTSAFIIAFITLLEMMFPGKQIVPSLIYSTEKTSLVMKGIRLKGPLRDYELLAQFCAVNIPIIFFMIVRSRRLLIKVGFSILLLMIFFVQFSTITRGAFVSLVIGLIYLAFICREDLNIVKATMLAGMFVGVAVAINYIMSTYTLSGSLFDRLFATTFERGVIPDTRMDSWSGAVERWLLHPIIGNGPGWDFTNNVEGRLWPHNGYLFYLNITGVFGLFAFLLFLYRLLRVSWKQVHVSLAGGPYAHSLMKILHVSLVIFIIDTVKVDYLRNHTYIYFVWAFFGLIAATATIISKSEERGETGGAVID